MAQGKKHVLTPELKAAILAGIEAGVDPDTAAQAEGISRSTFFEWMKAGADEASPFHDFRTEVARAIAIAEKKLVERWLDGDEKGVSFGPGKAAAEFLRLTKRRYGEKVRIQVADELEELLSIVERICRPEDFARVLEAIAARDRGEETPEAAGEPAPPVH